MSGRTVHQQGLATTCKDCVNEGKTEVMQRRAVRHMSPYERRRRGNALPGVHPTHPSTSAVAKGLWTLGGFRYGGCTQTSSWIHAIKERKLEHKITELNCDACKPMLKSQASQEDLCLKKCCAEPRFRTGLGKSDRPGSQGVLET